ncbi:uncharacterized protein At4g02000-like [Raphanus sativus]|uniref:Uncharacterized protein At4g02000-like n=1 Tax=Raphanus sativus TaxID=3726 RepID=A0A9W3DJE4_RAPSA|nr:uncharacterized protein At4g02000-like [Raphanus sativus]
MAEAELSFFSLSLARRDEGFKKTLRFCEKAGPFRFEDEEDLQLVLDNRPYHHNYWMVILQRWEPVISDSFPSMIPFWVSIKGLPLHYWHETMVFNVGKKLGAYEGQELTKTSARTRVLVNGLQPLIKETILEFGSGEEYKLTLEYERLENHCSYCSCLTHMSYECPEKQEKATQERNKNREGTLRRRSLFPDKEETFWRVKRSTPQQNESAISPLSSKQLDLQHDVVPIAQVPSTEEVLAEIQEATNLYLSCPDPTEAATRRQRFLQEDTQELLAKTAACIIAAAA